MKNTILGKIIEENSLNNKDQQILLALQQQLSQQNNPADLQKFQQEIQKVEDRLKKNGGDEQRSELIKQIEKFTGRKLITYFSIHGSLDNRDARIIEDFIISNNLSKFDILVDSPGGLTDAAEKLIEICRHRTRNGDEFDYRVIVVGQAKSAATLFALGANKILLCESAELGPVDPQITVFTPAGEMVRDSAHQIYYASEEYLNKSRKWLQKNDGDLLLLSKYDPVAIERAKVAINHTEDIIKKRVYSNPYLSKDYITNGDIVENDLRIFIDHREISYSHGRAIYYEDLVDFGFTKNKFIQKFDDHYLNDQNKTESEIKQINKALWELYIRSLEAVRSNIEPIVDNDGKIIGMNKIARKLFESANGLALTKDVLN